MYDSGALLLEQGGSGIRNCRFTPEYRVCWLRA